VIAGEATPQNLVATNRAVRLPSVAELKRRLVVGKTTFADW
jgi:hypothetical protein